MPAIHVEGLRDLDRAFKAADVALNKDLRKTLTAAAEPVRSGAEALAISGIPRMTVPWSRMRIGVTAHSVYVAPRKRGSRVARSKRPNLASLLLGRSMLPALEQNRERVLQEFDGLLEDVGRAWEASPGG